MAKVEDVLEILKGMTILELRDLNKAIEEEFGITAAAPMMAMAAAPAAGGGAAEAFHGARRLAGGAADHVRRRGACGRLIGAIAPFRGRCR